MSIYDSRMIVNGVVRGSSNIPVIPLPEVVPYPSIKLYRNAIFGFQDPAATIYELKMQPEKFLKVDPDGRVTSEFDLHTLDDATPVLNANDLALIWSVFGLIVTRFNKMIETERGMWMRGEWFPLLKIPFEDLRHNWGMSNYTPAQILGRFEELDNFFGSIKEKDDEYSHYKVLPYAGFDSSHIITFSPFLSQLYYKILDESKAYMKEREIFLPHCNLLCKKEMLNGRAMVARFLVVMLTNILLEAGELFKKQQIKKISKRISHLAIECPLFGVELNQAKNKSLYLNRLFENIEMVFKEETICYNYYKDFKVTIDFKGYRKLDDSFVVLTHQGKIENVTEL